MPNKLEIRRSDHQPRYIILDMTDAGTGIKQSLAFLEPHHGLMLDREYGLAFVLDKVWTWFGLWSFALREKE